VLEETNNMDEIQKNQQPEIENISKKERNVAANVKAINIAANTLSKSANPYLKAIGKGAKVANKIAPQATGKALHLANKTIPGGRSLQKATNMLSESGIADKFASNNSKNFGASNKPGHNSGLEQKKATTTTLDKENKLEGVSIIIPKNLKLGLMVGIPAITILMFCCLFVSASQTYVNVGGVGAADSVTESDLNNLNDEWHDEGAGSTEIEDVPEGETEKNSLNYNIVLLKNKAGNEITIDQINDLFGDTVRCSKEPCSDTPEFKFYLKMYDIYHRYKNKYNIELDLRLLMATLSIGENEIVKIFPKNLNDYDRTLLDDTDTILNIDWEYDYKKIEDYTYLSTKNFSYDMQILAKGMVTKTIHQKCTDSNGNIVAEKDAINVEDANFDSSHPQYLSCPDGSTYSKDEAKYEYNEKNYKEFLKQFFEYKFFLSDSIKQEIIAKENSQEQSSETPGQPENSEGIESSGEWRTWNSCMEPWGSLKINGTSSDMCNYGCAITAVAMAIAKSGVETILGENLNPGTVMQNLSFDNDLIYWGSTTNISSDFKYEKYISLAGLSKINVIDKLSNYLNNDYYIILGVGNESLRHYVLLDSYNKDTGELYMVDPDPTVSDSVVYNIYKVFSAQIYKKQSK